MKALIVEDDFSSRFLLQKFLEDYGTCYVAINGKEAVDAVQTAIDEDAPYDLICLDIMMPEMDGQDALKKIRSIETEKGILSSDGSKIIMTTALADMENVKNAYHSLCDGYITKPIDKQTLVQNLQTLQLV